MMTEKERPPTQKTLALRKRAKGKKPGFVRQESWRYVRLKQNWRHPRGIDNKVRKRIKGWPPMPGSGYRGPKAARGLHPSGYREVLVHNSAECKEVDPKTQAIRIAHSVGKRKRARIIADARKRKLIILNLKEVKEEAKEVTEEEKVAEEKEEKEEKKKEAKKAKKPEKPKRKREKPKETEAAEEKK